MSDCVMKFDLIITIVLKGFAEDAIEAARKAGAEGSTIIEGRGMGIHENAKILGMSIEPEKEIIFTLIDRNKTQPVLDAIADAVGLNKPGKGIAVVLKVEEAIGICHLLNK